MGIFGKFTEKKENDIIPVDTISNTGTIATPVNLYNFNFTHDKFKRIIKNTNSREWYNALYDILPKYNINTVETVAGFLAQTGHESLDYTVLIENLNYSAQRLHQVFPKRFPTIHSAQPYHRQPQLIANKIYSNRMGNGPPGSNDGWNYKGRGIIQITGKYNYTECSKYLFNDDTLVKSPDLIALDKKICIMSACWYWSSRKLNSYCNRKDISGMTKAINGGYIGLQDRCNRFNNALNVLR